VREVEWERARLFPVRLRSGTAKQRHQMSRSLVTTSLAATVTVIATAQIGYWCPTRLSQRGSGATRI
jgi:hypothetical protein